MQKYTLYACTETFLIVKMMVCFTSDVFFFVSGTKNNMKMIASPPSPSNEEKGFDFSA